MTDPTPHSDPQPRPVRRTDGVRVSAPEDASPERATVPDSVRAKAAALKPRRRFGGTEAQILSLIHISEPTRHFKRSRMPSSA